MISDPMVFCKSIECSGVSSLHHVSFGTACGLDAMYMGVPSCGLRKRTPSSVIVASFSKETIWKLKGSQ